MKKFPQSIRELSCLQPSDSVNAVALEASVAKSITKPAGARFVVFSGTDNYYVNYTEAATVPGDTTDGSASELNPTMRDLNGVSSISVISPAECVVTASFYVQ